MTKIIKTIGCWLLASCFCPLAMQADVVWYDGSNAVSYHVEGKAAPVVLQALRLFEGDMELVTGKKAVASKNAAIRIVQGKGCDDGFCISVKDGKIVVEGHNARGAAYGLLELSRMAGVSPWVWWGDVRPHSKNKLSLPDDFRMEKTPSVQYRGIFINDEDWSIRKWSQDNMGPQTYKRLFELMLRLRANIIWPAMHDVSPGFFTVKGNKEMADSFGILIGTSHCEPLLRNNVAEWQVKERGAYNYITNREAVKKYWAERLKQVKGSEEFFTIGMRGIHDGSMEGVKTPEEKLNGLLRVPDDVTLMWCDDNYGYLTRLPDAEQQKRKGGGGVYYHLSYWGRPHDYLWLTTTQPGLIYTEMKAAYDHNCRKLWIANVHDPKVAAYDLELFLDMAWDIESLTPSPSPKERGVFTLNQHLENWLCTQFGAEVGHAIAPAMREFYRLNGIRRPEFMGWTQVELDKKKYPGGKSVPTTTEFTRKQAFERMNDFARIEATVDVYAQMIPEYLRDAYFAHVLYPVHASAAMTRKMLSKSGKDYNLIQMLTEHYNTMNNGKWKGLMSAAPRDLPVFAPNVRTEVNENENQNGRLETWNLKPETCDFIARNACDYLKLETSNLKPQPIQMLGHSMKAVALAKGNTLIYEFESPVEGDAVLRTAMIPTQPSDKGDLRYEVRIDDQTPVVISLKEPYRSEQWKKNVLRCQALKQTPIRLTKGLHKLYIKALDDHIIVDQWMVDFNKERQFYVIPIK